MSRSSRRRCVATSADGTRCRRWALDGATQCHAHAPPASHAMHPPEARRCVATTTKGRRCRSWAIDERGLCATHAGRAGFKPGNQISWKDAVAGEHPPDARRCTARMKDGKRCTNWRMRDSEDGLCATHAGATGFKEGHLTHWKHGGYVRRVLPHEIPYYEEERAAFLDGARSLALEIALGRYLLGRIAELSDPDTISLSDLLDAAALVFRGTDCIASWVATEQMLGSDQEQVIRTIAYEMLAAEAEEADSD